jgi:hypothetical protein
MGLVAFVAPNPTGETENHSAEHYDGTNRDQRRDEFDDLCRLPPASGAQTDRKVPLAQLALHMRVLMSGLCVLVRMLAML